MNHQSNYWYVQQWQQQKWLTIGRPTVDSHCNTYK